MPRLSRLLAVARYEARTHMTGRQALRLAGVAAALLLPAGLVPTPRFKPPDLSPPLFADLNSEEAQRMGPPPPPKIRVRGTVPPELAERLVEAEHSPYELRSGNPVTLVAPEITAEMRQALETLEGPVRLEYRSYLIPGKLPGRSLLIAILAISLLTGPLADTLPGERSRRTLEVLLTAGITRGELIGGKWLAWTLSATLTAGLSAALACWSGVQAAGWWIVGLPLFVASAVALGLWLVRLVDDVVGGSAAPMRVLPVAAGTMAAVARGISEISPVAAAAVPIGGPLLLAADLFTSGPQAIAAGAGTVVFVLAILTRTGQDLDRVDTVSSPTRWGAIGLSAVATLLWWLTVAGPGVWSGAGTTTDLVTSLPRSMMVGGITLLACAVIAIARDPLGKRFRDRRDAAAGLAAGPPTSLLQTALVTLAVGAALAASGPLPEVQMAGVPETVLAMLARLRESAVPPDLAASPAIALAGAVSILGQTVLFRAVVGKSAGWVLASLLWCVAVCPWTPWSAIAAAFALGALAATHGWMAALAAHLMWAVAASAGSAPGAAASIGLQMIALAIAFGSTMLARGVPMRHQL